MTNAHDLACSLFFLFYCTFVRLVNSAPFTFDGNPSIFQHGDLGRAENITAIIEQASKSIGQSLVISSNSSDDEQYFIKIPGVGGDGPVSLELYYFHEPAMDRTALQHTLFDAQAKLWKQLLFDGNGPLEPDPWQTPRRRGEDATMLAKSFTHPETKVLNKMTFDTLLKVAGAVFHFLFVEGRRGSIISHVFDSRIAPKEKCGTVSVRPFGPKNGLMDLRFSQLEWSSASN